MLMPDIGVCFTPSTKLGCGILAAFKMVGVTPSLSGLRLEVEYFGVQVRLKRHVML